MDQALMTEAATRRSRTDAASAVQSISRAARVLYALAEHDAAGASLGAVASRAGLHKATVHRILSALIAEGFAEQDPVSRRYHLGLEATMLGAFAVNRLDMRQICDPSLCRIVERTEDTVFLTVRRGLEAVCLDRRDGTFPIKALPLDIGIHRPLGIGSGSLALLAFLPDEEVREIVSRNADATARFPNLPPAQLLSLVEETRRQGFAVNDGRVVRGMCGLAVPVFGQNQLPIAAISVAAIADRMPMGRRMEIVALLRREARLIEGILKPRRDAGERDAPPPCGERAEPEVVMIPAAGGQR
jgi:DNA-binding IclR family transcriptional regulator